MSELSNLSKIGHIIEIYDFIENQTEQTRLMNSKEQLFISIDSVTFESFHDFERIYYYESRNFHGILMWIEQNASNL